jgi:hypothetical protein
MLSELEERFEYWKDRSYTEFALDMINDEFFNGKIKIYYKDRGYEKDININDRIYKDFDSAFGYIKELYDLQNIKRKLNNVLSFTKK